MHPYVHSSTTHNSQDMEATVMSIDGWMDKEEWHIYTKEWNIVICNNMNGPRHYHAKWIKSEREKQIPSISLICGI